MKTLLGALLLLAAPRAATLRGEVIDADTGKPIPCRISIRGGDGAFHFPKSASPDGSAVDYRKQADPNKASIEHHVTLSAHPFSVELPPGAYTVTVQRGKEYLPETRVIQVGDEGATATF